jgi:two-component system chemotaxis sensor kinase CheA
VSNADEANNFFADFLDDYFAECEEHLTLARQNLLLLEAFIGEPSVEKTVVHELFRAFHSLKGLSGMMAVKEAEAVAHQMESYLRGLRDRDLVLSEGGFDALLNGTKAIEEIVEARRNQQPVPEIDNILAQLKAAIPPETPSVRGDRPSFKLKPEEQKQLDSAIARGETIWHFSFSPSAQLAARGITVNQVRDLLGQWGHLIHAAPRMGEKGSISFDFLVAGSDAEGEFGESQTDGLIWEAYRGHRGASARETPERETPERETPERETPEVSVPETPEQPAARETPPEEAPTEEPKVAPKGAIAPTAAPAPIAEKSSNVVRVDLPKLDELMRMVGELVIGRARLEDWSDRVTRDLPGAEARALQEINLTLERQLRDLREGVMRVRLVPVAEVFARMHFVVRDLVRETGVRDGSPQENRTTVPPPERKQVKLELSGQETEIDKFVVERMMDPLLHLVRNAISHGIEPEVERVAAGKAAHGTIALRASTAGEMVAIEIEDDGRGIDRDKAIAVGRARGLIDPDLSPDELASQYDAMALLDLLCAPGFSTRDVADLTSGRGVGMAIVKNTVYELGGTVTMTSERGRGTRFRIELPLTLAIADAAIVNVADQTYAIVQSALREVLEVNIETLVRFENNEAIPYRGSLLPLLYLADLFGLERDRDRRSLRVVVVGSGTSAIGLAVDRIVRQCEIVVRSLNDPFVQTVGIAGATELGDGRVVLILDIPSLVRHRESMGTNRETRRRFSFGDPTRSRNDGSAVSH